MTNGSGYNSAILEITTPGSSLNLVLMFRDHRAQHPGVATSINYATKRCSTTYRVSANCVPGSRESDKIDSRAPSLNFVIVLFRVFDYQFKDISFGCDRVYGREKDG